MTDQKLTRREFVGGSLAASLLTSMPIESQAKDETAGRMKYNLFWGDIHNHNAVGYAKGSLERSIENAREHLDFFAFTGHASWHDMPKMPGDRHLKWVRGFRKHTEHWSKTCQLLSEANSKDFVAIPGYEWHSSRFGDYCLLFEQNHPELFLPDHVNKLLDFAERKNALAIPHHVAYKQGWRGTNFDYFRPKTSPVVEIFSEHGCCENVKAPLPYIRHSMGGKSTANTIERQLKKGLRFGFVASSDSHRGYPGAYGEGVVGVWACELTAESIFEALRARRTYAATGDRIVLDVTLNGRPMGSQLEPVRDRQIDVQVEGQDSIQMIELIRNGRVIERYFPADHVSEPPQLPGRVKCRIQYGWGPWAALDLGRICSWDMTVRIEKGRFLKVIPCFQSAPFAEDIRDNLQIISPHEFHLRSQTSRLRCFAEDPTKAVVLEVEGGSDAELTVQLRHPTQQVVRTRLADLIRDNVITFTGVFTSESYIIHRLVGKGEYSATVQFHDKQNTAKGPDWYYVRVTQNNGQLAWSSPVWVG